MQHSFQRYVIIAHGTCGIANTLQAKMAPRMGLKLSELVELVSKVPIPDHQKNVIFEIVVEDADGEDVEVPYVMMTLP